MIEEEVLDAGMFEEPEGYAPPAPEFRFAKYERELEKTLVKEPKLIELRLVGKSPLWGHLLWNAGIYTAQYLDKHAERLIRGRNVLELGAAAGLPSIICGVNGCNRLVSTDYPDPELIENLGFNLSKNVGFGPPKVRVEGFIWGSDSRSLLLGLENGDSDRKVCEEDKFDLVILSDLVFNHSEHEKLLRSCREVVKKDGRCLVVFSPHRPRLLQQDLLFFENCQDFDFKAEKIDLVTWKPMFEEDDETAEIRSRVYSYFLVPQW